MFFGVCWLIYGMEIKLRPLLPAALQIHPQTENTDEEFYYSLALKIVPSTNCSEHRNHYS